MSVTAVIKSFANGGEAVGTLENGKTVFVRGAIPGEVVELDIIQDKKRYCRGRLLKVIKTSPERIVPECRFFPECPGCSYSHVSYECELQWKQKQLEYLARNSNCLKINAPVGSPLRKNWRNRITLHIKNGRCGYFSSDNTTLLQIDNCLLAAEEINRVLPFSNVPDDGSVLLRVGNGKKVLVMRRNGKNCGTVTESLGEYGSFEVDAAGFFQTNNAVAVKLIEKVVSAVKESSLRHLCELYCGVGVFSICCAEKIPDLDSIAVEISGTAVRCCKKNAAAHKVASRCRFFAGDAADKFSHCIPDDGRFILLVDPPRSGMDKKMVSDIRKYHPQELIYISCAADTLMRDISGLSDLYQLCELTLFDMFPSTAHFETVALLKARS